MGSDFPLETPWSGRRSGRVDWNETFALLSQRIEKNPQDVVSWTSRSLVRQYLRDYEGAARDVDEALRIDPKSLYATLRQADLLKRLGSYDEAMATYDKAIAIAPSNAHGYLSRGDGYFEQDRPAEAIADFTRAIELRPNWPLPYFNRAQARSHNDVRDYEGALRDYEEFFRIEKECTELIAVARGLRAFLYIDLGLYQEAIADLSAKIEASPQGADAGDYLTRSKVYMRLGDVVRAEQDSQKGHEIKAAAREEEKRRGNYPAE
jgi:tetratricopeptide (TPR) repeat protein